MSNASIATGSSPSRAAAATGPASLPALPAMPGGIEAAPTRFFCRVPAFGFVSIREWIYSTGRRELGALGRGTGMNAFAAKLVYGLGLLLLAALAVMPQQKMRVEAVAAAVPMLTAEDRLAQAIHDRVAVEAAAQRDDAALRKLRAEEDGLRRLAFESDAKASREHLINALADSLSAAMLTRANIASGGARTEELDRADAVVRKLTAAINDEVRGLAT